MIGFGLAMRGGLSRRRTPGFHSGPGFPGGLGCLAAAGDCGELRWITLERIRALYGDDPRTSRTDPPTPQPVDLGGLDYEDEAQTTVDLGDLDTYRGVARRCGRHDKTVRDWCRRRGVPPSAYEQAFRRGEL